MSLFSPSSVIALLAVVAALGALLVFSRIVLPLLPSNLEPDLASEPQSPPGITVPPAESTSLPSRDTVLPADAAKSPAFAPLPPPLLTNSAQVSLNFYSLQNAPGLERSNPPAARAISGLLWVSDGITEAERDTAESIVYLAATEEGLFAELMSKAWLNEAEINELEKIVLGLEVIAAEDPEEARTLAAMPFLETLQTPDALAVESLANLAYFEPSSYQRVMAHPVVGDGITDEEAKLVGLLFETVPRHPELLQRLLNPGSTFAEERTIRLPLAGEVVLAIFRTRPGPARSMDLLENAVRATESFLGEPLPTRYVALLFEDAVPAIFGGANSGTHMIILPEYDIDDGSYESSQAGLVIAHEVAHYYWHGGEDWLDEGAAEFTATLVEHLREGQPLDTVNYPCDSGHTIRYLETMPIPETHPAYICNYAVGERFFLDLYKIMDEKEFRRGFRDLYRRLLENKSAPTGRAGMAEARATFLDSDNTLSEDSRQEAELAIARWYEGNVPGAPASLDTRPVVAELPTVYGWIDRAYISLSEGGPPSKAFSASNLEDWAWLTLEYSHDYAGPPQELTFQVVEYYEDGFPYRRGTFTIQAERQYSGGVQWLSVGPGPEQEWAPGRHWIYVYHEGRKVAEVSFEVTP